MFAVKEAYFPFLDSVDLILNQEIKLKITIFLYKGLKKPSKLLCVEL